MGDLDVGLMNRRKARGLLASASARAPDLLPVRAKLIQATTDLIHRRVTGAPSDGTLPTIDEALRVIEELFARHVAEACTEGCEGAVTVCQAQGVAEDVGSTGNDDVP